VPSQAQSGVALYSQAAVLDAAAPNGSFQMSGGESFGIHDAPAAIVERFDDPVVGGYRGSFDAGTKGRLQGAPGSVRTKNTIDPQGSVFGSPIHGGLLPFGARYQVVFRPQDLGATGSEEIVRSVRWKLFGPSLQQDLFESIAISLGHSHIQPDYTIDPFSALPKFPDSGLRGIYGANYKPGDPVGTKTMWRGPYVIFPGLLQPDGYVPYPAFSSGYPYNGRDSLVFELRTHRSQLAIGINGQEVRLMVTSSPRPDGRIYANGTAAAPLDPDQTVIAHMGDNALPNYQFEFVKVKSDATSPWLAAPKPNPTYRTPVVALAQPAGTAIVLEYRGADDSAGGNATAWSDDIGNANGKAFLQYRVAFTSDWQSLAAPSLDTIVFPVD
jgi:hypothetical protein